MVTASDAQVVRAELEPSSSLGPRHPPFSSDLGAPRPRVSPKPQGLCACTAEASMCAARVGWEAAPRYLRPSELVSAA